MKHFVCALLLCLCLLSIVQAQTHYKALLTQDGTDAPVADVAVNEFASTPMWSRIAAGTYKMELTNAFVGKVFYRLPASEEGFSNSIMLVREVHDSYIVIFTGTIDGQSFDGILGNVTGRGTPFEIEAY